MVVQNSRISARFVSHLQKRGNNKGLRLAIRLPAITTISIILILLLTAFVSSGFILFTTTVNSLHLTNYSVSTQTFTDRLDPSYIVVGGQSGDWWYPYQYPELFKFTPNFQSPSSYDFSSSPLATLSGQGTVWSGGFNGSNWLISGWGSGKYLNPYISLFNETTTGKTHLGNYSEIGSLEQEWAGGDVFSVGWNGTDWLLTGMGSGSLFPGEDVTNHMSIAVLSSNGTFTDLSPQIPNQDDLILYTNAWNGQYWLIGGGWFGFSTGKLYVLSGGEITDITSQIASAVPTFNSVQSIVWNGQDFLIGGIGFLAEYNGSTFTDLTAQLNSALGMSHSLNNIANNAVNSIAWMGTYWMLAGGTPVAYSYMISNQSAWVATFTPESTSFKDITSAVIPHDILKSDTNSTILTMSCSIWSGCAIGGADSNGGVLLWYNGQKTLDLSSALTNTTYVQWVELADALFKS